MRKRVECAFFWTAHELTVMAPFQVAVKPTLL
jgi:hypothetical protein